MAHSRASGRRLAQRHEPRQLGAGPLFEARPSATPALVSASLETDPSTVANAAPPPNIPQALTSSSSDTLVSSTPSAAVASPTPAAGVEIPTSISTIIPAMCAVLGVLILSFVLWNLWLRKQRRKAKLAAQQAPEYDAETQKTKSTRLIIEPATPIGISPIQSGLPSSPKDWKPQTNKGGTVLPIAVKLTTSTSPASTPNEKYAFDLPTPPPVATPAAPKRYSIFGHVRAMPEFRDREAKPVRSYSTRSASLLSSRMSTRRKPTQGEAPPVPNVPTFFVTDCDSPVETSSPLPSMAGKLVSVVSPFDSSMPDELPVAVGETLRIIEVYEDDWCLAERVGRKKGRGILPQTCVSEKQLVEPKKRFSTLMLK